RAQQHMLGLLHPVALAQLGRKEAPDARLQQHHAAAVLAHQQGPARERDAAELVGRTPALPQRPRAVAEHGAPVEALRVAEDRAKLHDAEIAPPSSRHYRGLGAGRRGRPRNLATRGAGRTSDLQYHPAVSPAASPAMSPTQSPTQSKLRQRLTTLFTVIGIMSTLLV